MVRWLPALRALSACAWAYETCGIEQVCLIVCRQLRSRRGEWFRALCLCLCLCLGGRRVQYLVGTTRNSSLHHPLPAIRLPDPLRPPLPCYRHGRVHATRYSTCSLQCLQHSRRVLCDVPLYICTSVRVPLHGLHRPRRDPAALSRNP